MKNGTMVAMILAGGRGTRLESLTTSVAKPAVNYGGKYRIIDFPLSNCANSGINVVGVLTQYESVYLNSYVGNGYKWGIDANDGGVFVLPPREKTSGFNIYRGTADAITQNLDFLDQYDPDYLLVLSGDHIYKMDYSKMLAIHKENNADATIAVLEVPLREASRFGIMNTDENDRIIEFEEKPKKPKSNLASMGIYIFNYNTVKKELLLDEKNADSDHDFGKNIIPKLLKDNKKLMAYRFKGYWKDVGTINSLWEANMDLLGENPELELNDDNWKIYSEDVNMAPQFIGTNAIVRNAYINQGCKVDGTVINSVLFTDVDVKQNARVIDSVLMPGVQIAEGAEIHRSIIAPNVKIGKNAVIGVPDSENILLVSEDVRGDK